MLEIRKKRSPHEAGDESELGGDAPGNHRLVAHWKLLGTASRDAHLSHGDVAVLWAILDRIGADATAWPGFRRLANDTGLHRSSIARSVGRLVATKYLIRESGGPGKTNRYRAGSGTAATNTSRSVATSSGAAPSRSAAPEVVASKRLGVVASARPEPASLNQYQEPASLNAADAAAFAEPPSSKRKARKPKSDGMTFATWRASIQEGEDLIRYDDPVFDYGHRIGVTESMLEVAWLMFCDRVDDGVKKQRDWPATFRTYVRRGWLDAWRFGRDGSAYLSPAGEQTAREHGIEVQR